MNKPPPLSYAHVHAEPWKLSTHEDTPEIVTTGGAHVTCIDDLDVGLHIVAVHNAALTLHDAMRHTAQ